MARADSAATPLAAALVFRDGLMIALLALRPLRRKNFIAIDLEVPFPATPLPALARYLDHLRPVLRAQRTTRGASRQGIAAPTNALWLTQYGVPFSANADGAALRTPLSPTPSPDYPGFPASTC